jgi:hypothetical protein
MAPGVTEGASAIGAVTSVSTIEVRSPADGRIVGTFQQPLPTNGWKDPGIGSRSGGTPGMLKSCRQQPIVSECIHLSAEPHWYRYVPKMRSRRVYGPRKPTAARRRRPGQADPRSHRRRPVPHPLGSRRSNGGRG